MLTLRLSVDQGDSSGQMVVEALSGDAAELISLADELGARRDIQVVGTVQTLAEVPTPAQDLE